MKSKLFKTLILFLLFVVFLLPLVGCASVRGMTFSELGMKKSDFDLLSGEFVRIENDDDIDSMNDQLELIARYAFRHRYPYFIILNKDMSAWENSSSNAIVNNGIAFQHSSSSLKYNYRIVSYVFSSEEESDGFLDGGTPVYETANYWTAGKEIWRKVRIPFFVTLGVGTFVAYAQVIAHIDE